MSKLSPDRRKGSALIEFSLSTIIWVPLLLGTFIIGLNLVRALQATQISRDAARLYAYGADFSQTSARDILTQKLASGFDISASGDGVIIFSTVFRVGPADCTGAGYAANSGTCPNLDQYVFTRSITIGNSALLASSFGSATGMDTSGNIPAATYLLNNADRAPGFAALLPMSDGQVGYASEVYLSSQGLNWPGVFISPGVYGREIF